jgi:hypothetical protein
MPDGAQGGASEVGKFSQPTADFSVGRCARRRRPRNVASILDSARELRFERCPLATAARAQHTFSQVPRWTIQRALRFACGSTSTRAKYSEGLETFPDRDVRTIECLTWANTRGRDTIKGGVRTVRTGTSRITWHPRCLVGSYDANSRPRRLAVQLPLGCSGFRIHAERQELRDLRTGPSHQAARVRILLRDVSAMGGVGRSGRMVRRQGTTLQLPLDCRRLCVLP